MNKEEWWSEYLQNDISLRSFTDQENKLFEEYKLTSDQKRIFQIIKNTKNLPNVDAEQIIWAIGVCSFNARGDMKFYVRQVQERILKLPEAESKYQWDSAVWTKPTMKLLILNWWHGVMVVSPELCTKDKSPMVFVHEFFDFIPKVKDQSDEYKATNLSMYVLMCRSICNSYPMATMKGLVSFSDSQDFNWDRYDTDLKLRNSNIQSLIPNKLVRMIISNLDEKMWDFIKQMGDSALKRYGFAAYDSYEMAVKENHVFYLQIYPLLLVALIK